MKYEKIYKDITRYPNVEALFVAMQKTEQWAKMTRPQRMEAMHQAEGEYEMEMAAKKRFGGMDEELKQQAPDLTGRMNQAIVDKLSQYSPTVGSVAGAVLPNSNAQAFIDAALFAVPGGEVGELVSPLARLAMRAAVPTVAGAVGGATSGDPVGGAASGLAQAAGGEALGATLGLGKRTVHDLDFNRLRSWLEPRLEKKMPDVATFKRLFRGGEAIKSAEARMTPIADKIQKKVGNIKLNIDPALAPIVTQRNPHLLVSGNTIIVQPDQINELLNSIENIGWDYKRDPTQSHIGAMARSAVHQIEGEVYPEIEKVDKKLASDWYTARGRIRSARTLTNMFSEPGVLEQVVKDPQTGTMIEKNRISFEKLQKLVSDAGQNGYKNDLAQSMTDGEQKSFSKMVHRGAQEGTEDIPGRGPIKSVGMGMFLGVVPHPYFRLQSTWPSRHVGELPFDLGRGRALTMALVDGPYRFVRGLENLYSQITSPAPSPKPIAPAVEPVVSPPIESAGDKVPAMHITKSPDEMRAMK